MMINLKVPKLAERNSNLLAQEASFRKTRSKFS